MDIFKEVTSVMSARFDADESTITKETSIADDLGADSLDVVDLLMDIEDKFGVSIPDEDAAKLSTVGDVVDYIESHAE